MKSASGLKLYLSPEGGFGLMRSDALAFDAKEEAEMAAMNKTIAEPLYISKMTVVEDDGVDQDLSRYTLEDIIDTYGSGVRLNLSAVPLRRSAR